MSELNNVKISGSGTVSGGEYNEIKISGSGDILGDVISESISIAGSCDCKGEIRTNNFKASGSCDFYKDIYVNDELRVSGSCDFKGNITGGDIKISGSADISGNVSFNRMNIAGSADINGNCEGSDFCVSGAAKIDGLLSADKIEINLYGNSEIKEIGGEEILVQNAKKKMFLQLNFGFKRKFLTTNLIEGDKITLENTKCKIVRGHDIVIGPGCEIDKVEYTGKLTIDKDSTVGEEECMKS